jgi:hypothetical protein
MSHPHYGPCINADFINRLRAFSERTFGPGIRGGVVDHIKKELVEVEETGLTDLTEWVDIIILAIDGAWRAGHAPYEIIDGVHAKLIRNEARTWPDWRNLPQDKAIEHDRTVEETL